MQSEVVNYNTEELIVKDIKTHVGKIKAGSYYRGQILVYQNNNWEAVTTISADKKLGVFLGSGITPEGSPKTSAVAFNDAIIVFGEIYEKGLKDSTGKSISLSEANIVEMIKSSLFVRRI